MADSAQVFRDGKTHKVASFSNKDGIEHRGRGSSLEEAAAEALVKVLALKKPVGEGA